MPAAPGRGTFGIPLDAVPAGGGVGITLNLDFTGGKNVAAGDFALEQMSGAIGFVQSMYLDNSLNTKSITITFGGTLQAITLKAGQQGYFPIIPANGTFTWSALSTGAGINVPVIFMNAPLAAATVWQAV